MTAPTASSARVAHNLRLMKEGDDGFNRRDNAHFVAAHHRDMVAHVMGSLDPVVGRDALGTALDSMLRAFPDMRVQNDPYPIQFGADDWTTVIGRVTGTFTGELAMPDGTVVPGTGKSFEVDLTTTARWEGELMVEEWVFWDSALMAQQLGLGAQ
jgi:hypothetical protein